MTEFSRDTERELARLADSSLTDEDRERAQARVHRSQELRIALAEQRRTVKLLAAIDVQAPASLHREIEEMVDPAAHQPRRARGTTRLGVATALAAVIALVAVVVGLSVDGSSELTAQQAAALTLRPATMPAPHESRAHKTQLSVAVDGVSFPYWRERFGWRSSGTRSDRLAGQTVRTVFYTNANGMRIGYAIASGGAPTSHGGTAVRRWGVTYRLLSHDGARVITWQRDGHLCVISGRGVSSRTLLRLASWDGDTPRRS